MRIAFCSDVHIGNFHKFGGAMEVGLNARCRAVCDALDRAVDRAKRLGCEAFYVAGDLFDSTKPSPQMIVRVQHALSQMRSYVIVGNHDQQSYDVGDNACGPLTASAVRVIDRPALVGYDEHNVDIFAVPFRPGPAEDWIEEDVAEVKGRVRTGRPASSRRALVLHLGLYEDDAMPHWAKGSNDCIPLSLLRDLMRRFEIDAVFAGNWHWHKKWSKPRIVQCGALAPTGFGDLGLAGHGIVVWDTDTLETKHVEVPGPRFIDVPPPGQPWNLQTYRDAAEAGCRIYARAKVPADKVGNQAGHFRAADPEGVLFAGFTVLPDTSEAEAAARTAATVARSAETLLDALTGFVGEMPLDEGVERDRVLQRCRLYLNTD
ncbi:hypothetical protein LCGC14_0455510 [marine sediment metagenome]|uniref:Calcineurin-like phosphoesterase domain-containing protein n=1 Tax=marine sediment metagenome TaxID=412755 RepID=A0A0F9SGI2_9ZZZZ